MNQFTFQSFAREFTRLSVDDFSAAGERYFRYRGMDPKTVVVEKHFLDFLHFLDFEEMLSKFQNAVEKSVREPLPRRRLKNSFKNELLNERLIPVPQEPMSRVQNAIVKLKTIQVK